MNFRNAYLTPSALEGSQILDLSLSPMVVTQMIQNRSWRQLLSIQVGVNRNYLICTGQ